jgi:hypothetical protein
MATSLFQMRIDLGSPRETAGLRRRAKRLARKEKDAPLPGRLMVENLAEL